MTQKLIALAVHPSALPGEASAAALQACRLIQDHGLLEMPSPPTRSTRDRKEKSKKDASPAYTPVEVVVMTTAKFTGRCDACRVAFQIGEPVAWLPKTEKRKSKAWHPACYDLFGRPG